MSDINTVEAQRHLSIYVVRAAAGERFVIHRRNRPMAVLVGLDELERLHRSAALGRRLTHALGQEPAILDAIAAGTLHPVMAAFGLWRDEGDLADLAADIERNRTSQLRRPAQ